MNNHTDHEADRDAIATSQMLGIVIISAGALACALMIGIACFAACHKEKSPAVIEGERNGNTHRVLCQDAHASANVNRSSDLSRRTNFCPAILCCAVAVTEPCQNGRADQFERVAECKTHIRQMVGTSFHRHAGSTPAALTTFQSHKVASKVAIGQQNKSSAECNSAMDRSVVV